MKYESIHARARQRQILRVWRQSARECRRADRDRWYHRPTEAEKTYRRLAKSTARLIQRIELEGYLCK